MCEKPAIDGATHPKCITRYSLDGLTSFFRYDGVIRKAVKTLKYRLVTDLASEFVSLVPNTSFQRITDPSSLNPVPCVLVPIPLHPSRRKERGFNQAEVLGRLILDKLNIPMKTDILVRTRKTTPQADLKQRKDRLENMKDVFAFHNSPFMIHNSRVVLFDDVFTTGATMRSAGNTLKRNGAKWVWAVTMAR